MYLLEIFGSLLIPPPPCPVPGNKKTATTRVPHIGSHNVYQVSEQLSQWNSEIVISFLCV